MDDGWTSQLDIKNFKLNLAAGHCVELVSNVNFPTAVMSGVRIPVSETASNVPMLPLAYLLCQSTIVSVCIPIAMQQNEILEIPCVMN